MLGCYCVVPIFFRFMYTTVFQGLSYQICHLNLKNCYPDLHAHNAPHIPASLFYILICILEFQKNHNKTGSNFAPSMPQLLVAAQLYMQ